MRPDLIAQLADVFARYKAAPHAGTADLVPGGTMYSGPGGVFGTIGLEREVISTRMQGNGLARMLPGRGTDILYPMFAYFTGFTDGSGSNKTAACDDPPTAGDGKSCMQIATFGWYEFQTKTLDITQVGRHLNRADTQDLILVNDPMGDFRANAGSVVAPNVVNNLQLQNEVAQRFNALAIEFSNKLSRQVYIGNPANNTDGYREFPGLDLLIRTGIKDAETGNACPTLDSALYNFQFRPVDEISNTTGGGIVNLLTYALRQLKITATGTGLDPVRWALVMRETLFYEITALWPCSYLTYRCSPQDGSTPNYNSNDYIAMRDDMRQNNYLIMDGERYEVILDPAIPELTNTTSASVPNGSFVSDIYILPMTYLGNQAGLFWEFRDFTTATMPAVEEGRLGAYYWTDGGRYLFHTKTPINWCVQWLARVEPRIILRVPHLAARIRNIRYTPLMHPRDVYSDQPYFVNGGVTGGRPVAPSLAYGSW